LPWIPEESQQQQAEARDDFGEEALGGRSPALDYTIAPEFQDQNNPFMSGTLGPLDHLKGDDRITIVASSSRKSLGQRWQKGWQKVGTTSAKLLPRRKVAPANPWRPSVRVTPSSTP
jgi:hypothetical protein